MATHESSKKRARQAIKRRERNRKYVSSVRSAVKSFKAAIAAGEGKEALVNLFTTAQTALAKAAQKGLLHSNNASRSISRLAATLNKVEGTGGKTVVAKPVKKAVKKPATAAKKASKAKTSAPAKKAKTSKRK